jgi:hypothetical protein
MGIKLLLLLIVKAMTTTITTANAFIIQQFLQLTTHFKISKYLEEKLILFANGYVVVNKLVVLYKNGLSV